ncbi:hypothetical protein BGZ46_009553, partial [Entomortierella lignicola]
MVSQNTSRPRLILLLGTAVLLQSMLVTNVAGAGTGERHDNRSIKQGQSEILVAESLASIPEPNLAYASIPATPIKYAIEDTYQTKGNGRQVIPKIPVKANDGKKGNDKKNNTDKPNNDKINEEKKEDSSKEQGIDVDDIKPKVDGYMDDLWKDVVKLGDDPKIKSTIADLQQDPSKLKDKIARLNEDPDAKAKAASPSEDPDLKAKIASLQNNPTIQSGIETLKKQAETFKNQFSNTELLKQQEEAEKSESSQKYNKYEKEVKENKNAPADKKKEDHASGQVKNIHTASPKPVPHSFAKPVPGQAQVTKPSVMVIPKPDKDVNPKPGNTKLPNNKLPIQSEPVIPKPSIKVLTPSQSPKQIAIPDKVSNAKQMQAAIPICTKAIAMSTVTTTTTSVPIPDVEDTGDTGDDGNEEKEDKDTQTPVTDDDKSNNPPSKPIIKKNNNMIKKRQILPTFGPGNNGNANMNANPLSPTNANIPAKPEGGNRDLNVVVHFVGDDYAKPEAKGAPVIEVEKDPKKDKKDHNKDKKDPKKAKQNPNEVKQDPKEVKQDPKEVKQEAKVPVVEAKLEDNANNVPVVQDKDIDQEQKNDKNRPDLGQY